MTTYRKPYYDKNKNKFNERSNKYYQQNKEKILARAKEKRQARTPEQIEDVVDIMLGECEHCYPAIYQVANHGVLATHAANVAMFTTDGEA